MEYPHSCPQFWRSKRNSNFTLFIELYFGVSEQIKPLQPIGQAAEFKFESKFEPLPTSAGHLAITPEGYSRRQSKDLIAISMAKLLGPRSGTGWAGRTDKHKHRVAGGQAPARRGARRPRPGKGGLGDVGLGTRCTMGRAGAA